MTLLFVFGFTDYSPDSLTLLMGIVAYYTIGAGFTIYKWVNLVTQIRVFTSNLAPVTDDWMLRHLAHVEFEPNNATDGVMTLPPDPYEFRTRLMLWFGFWPSFTFLRPLTRLHKKAGRFLWSKFHQVSMEIYEN